MKNTFPLIVLLFVCPALADENCTAVKKEAVCTEDSVKAQVVHACKALEERGRDALPELNSLRYDCCGEPNYVFIFDTDGKLQMHPFRPNQIGQSLLGEKDSKGKKFYVEFIKANKASADGEAWVDYLKPKFQDTKQYAKHTLIKACKLKSGENWLVGSGTWKE